MKNPKWFNSNKNISGLLCLVVFILIIGWLSAISLPDRSFKPGKGRETEGKNAVGVLNRAQQAYYFENGTFLTESQLQATKNALGVIIPESKYYNFAVETTPTIAYALAIPEDEQEPGIRGYSGGLFFDKKEKAHQQIICQTKTKDINQKPSKPILRNDVLTCPEGMTLNEYFKHIYEEHSLKLHN